MSKWIYFKDISFNISIQFSSIWTIDRTLSDANSPGTEWAWGVMAMNGYSTFRKAPALLKPCDRIV